MPAGRMSNMRKYAHKIKQLVAISPALGSFCSAPLAPLAPLAAQDPMDPLGRCHFGFLGVFGWLLVFNLGRHKRNAEPQVLASDEFQSQCQSTEFIWRHIKTGQPYPYF